MGFVLELFSGAGGGRGCFKWPYQAERQMWVFFDPEKDALSNASESSDNACPWDQGENCMLLYTFSHLDVRITGY